MTFKITIEVDGQSEQQLAPILSQWASIEPPLLRHENPAYLQQQVQQLLAQNAQLQTQLASRPPALPAAPERKAIAPAVVETVSQPPALPAQYQKPRHRARRWLNQSLRQLRHIFFRKELPIFLLIATGTFATAALTPLVNKRLWPPPQSPPEYSEENGGPGAAAEVPTRTPPPPDATPSKAGNHPPPPPAFQE